MFFFIKSIGMQSHQNKVGNPNYVGASNLTYHLRHSKNFIDQRNEYKSMGDIIKTHESYVNL